MIEIDTIKDLLKKARGKNALGGLNPIAQHRIRASLLDGIYAGNIPSSSVHHVFVQNKGVVFMRTAFFSLAGLLLVSSTAYAASVSKPGDTLYTVKRAQEEVRLQLKFSDESKVELQTRLAEKRVKELTQARSTVEASGDSSVKEAEAQVNNAVEKLTDVQAKLEARGNTQAAASIGEAIARIRNQASIQGQVKSEQDKVEHKNEDKKDKTVPASERVRVEGKTETEVE
jgi:hypothetical protein